ncbi:MAG: glycosyltransferase family 4 protein [Oscillochloris sp.]|nr:glycosyltransferase family 4 protein [Oscillochloris sp.]
MRIGIDARYIGDHFPGIGRYIVSLTTALAQIEHRHTLVVIHRSGAHDGDRYGFAATLDLPGVEAVAAGSTAFGPGQQYELPHLARRLKLDLYHAPYFIRPLFGMPCATVMTVYDLLGRRYPETLSLRGRILYRLLMRISLHRADRLLAISQHARHELAVLYGIPPEQVPVTPLAADPRFQPQPQDRIIALRRHYSLDRPYLLYVGSNKPHKNLARLVRAWALVIGAGKAADAQLLLAGHEDPRHPEIRTLVAASGLGGRIRFLPNIADNDLPALYGGALGFVFPSYYEGFGLPPLEAMACGVPVICSQAASLPEVVGDAGLLVDPANVVAIADAIGRLISEPDLRADLRRRSLVQAAQFSWRRTAEATLAVYEKAGKRRDFAGE